MGLGQACCTTRKYVIRPRNRRSKNSWGRGRRSVWGNRLHLMSWGLKTKEDSKKRNQKNWDGPIRKIGTRVGIDFGSIIACLLLFFCFLNLINLMHSLIWEMKKSSKISLKLIKNFLSGLALLYRIIHSSMVWKRRIVKKCKSGLKKKKKKKSWNSCLVWCYVLSRRTKNLFIDWNVTQRRKEIDVRKQWVLTSLIDVLADDKTDVAAVTSSLKPRK